MKAAVYTEYGSPDVLQIKEVARPEPGAGEVLVKVVASSANAADWRLLRADPFFVRFESGLFRPKQQIPGADVSGIVTALGPGVTRFKIGDAVYGDISETGRGGFAEYVVTTAETLAQKPAGLTHEQAAAIPLAGVTALQALRDYGNIQAGQQVLINGASGGVGSYAVQIAKAFGAEVTAVCSTRKIEMVKALGADHAIDYTNEDFTQNGLQYDLILAANGYHPIRAYKRSLKANGTYICSGGTMRQIFAGMLLGGLMSRGSSQTLTSMMAKPSGADLETMNKLFAAGKIKPVIDKTFPLAESPAALHYLEAGYPQGKVIITVN